MNRQGHESASFFIGPEVEHTPANSKRTLFVVGQQPVGEIERLARHNRTPHIFMGANHSFDAGDGTDGYWDHAITALLDKGFWVTLDYPAHTHSTVLKMLNPGIWQSRIFVPLLRVPVPHIETSNPNLTLKIDDIDFAATNPGVWCFAYHELTDSNRFTDWRDYADDSIVQGLEVAAPPTPKKPEPKPTIEPVSEPEPVIEKNDNEAGLDVQGPSVLQSENAQEKTEEVEAPSLDQILEQIVDTSVDTAESADLPATEVPKEKKSAPKKAK